MTVLVAFGLAGNVDHGTSTEKSAGPPPPITVSAPPSDAAAAGPCAQVLSALPVQLGQLAPRVVHTRPDSPNVVAWGDPAVVLRCGVPRPEAFVPTSDVYNIGNVYWLAVKQKAATVWTVIDRAVYVEVTVPEKQAFQPLPLLGKAIATKLKPICAVPEDQTTPPQNRLCVNRK
ncbi:MAG TPA: DUF3515 domain-containing protein [Jatrophihabitantaceae bacterium]